MGMGRAESGRVDTCMLGRTALCRRRCSSGARQARLRAKADANVPVLWYQHGGARMRSIIRACVCGWPSLKSSRVWPVSTLGSPVSRVQFPLSGGRVSSCPAGTQIRTWRASLALLVCWRPSGLEIDEHQHRLVSVSARGAHRLPPGTCTSGKIGAAQLR